MTTRSTNDFSAMDDVGGDNRTPKLRKRRLRKPQSDANIRVQQHSMVCVIVAATLL